MVTLCTGCCETTHPKPTSRRNYVELFFLNGFFYPAHLKKKHFYFFIFLRLHIYESVLINLKKEGGGG